MPGASSQAAAVAAQALAAVPRHRRELFLLRLDRWWDDLVGGLRAAYEADAADALALAICHLWRGAATTRLAEAQIAAASGR